MVIYRINKQVVYDNDMKGKDIRYVWLLVLRSHISRLVYTQKAHIMSR